MFISMIIYLCIWWLPNSSINIHDEKWVLFIKVLKDTTTKGGLAYILFFKFIKLPSLVTEFWLVVWAARKLDLKNKENIILK